MLFRPCSRVGYFSLICSPYGPWYYTDNEYKDGEKILAQDYKLVMDRDDKIEVIIEKEGYAMKLEYTKISSPVHIQDKAKLIRNRKTTNK